MSKLNNAIISFPPHNESIYFVRKLIPLLLRETYFDVTKSKISKSICTSQNKNYISIVREDHQFTGF